MDDESFEGHKLLLWIFPDSQIKQYMASWNPVAAELERIAVVHLRDGEEETEMTSWWQEKQICNP